MDADYQRWLWEKSAERCVKNLNKNKVTPDLDSALKRVREIAAPMRAKSLNMQTPCAENGRCTDCKSPQRICRITTILHRKPMLTDISVFLINQSLGF